MLRRRPLALTVSSPALGLALWITGALTLSIAGCTREDRTHVPSEPGVGEPPPVHPDPGSGAGGGTSGGVAPPATPVPQTAVVSQRTGFYKTASKDAKVSDPSGKGQQSNWIALLQRGDGLSLIETQGEWSQVEVSGGVRGFVPSNAVLAGAAIAPATTQEAIVIFDRPDPVAVTKTRLDPGSLVFIVGKQERFAEVNVRGTKTAWVLADQLDTSADEVQLARMIEKTRYLQEKEKGEGTKELLEVATATFPTAKLLPALRALVQGPAATTTATVGPAPTAP